MILDFQIAVEGLKWENAAAYSASQAAFSRCHCRLESASNASANSGIVHSLLAAHRQEARQSPALVLLAVPALLVAA